MDKILSIAHPYYVPILMRTQQLLNLVKSLCNGNCSCSVLSKLRSLASADSASADYASLLTTMCNWKRGNEVLELISDWLEPFLVLTSAPRQRVS